jgi:hypothetical protein
MVRCLPGGKWNACLTLCMLSLFMWQLYTSPGSALYMFVAVSHRPRHADCRQTDFAKIVQGFKLILESLDIWKPWRKRRLQFHLLYVTRYQRKS